MGTGLDLRRNQLFQGLNGCDLADLLSRARQKSIAKGSAFFHEQEQAAHCHLLTGGQIKLTQNSVEGGQLVVRFLGAGEVFGWAMVLGTTHYPGTAEAVTDSVALVWEAETMREAMLAHPTLALNALELVGGRLHEAQERLLELATERVERRIARAVLRLMAQAGRPAAKGVEVAFPLSRQDLADAVGATLHTVSRILASWEQRGVLGGGRQRLVVLLPDWLEALVDDRAIGQL